MEETAALDIDSPTCACEEHCLFCVLNQKPSRKKNTKTTTRYILSHMRVRRTHFFDKKGNLPRKTTKQQIYHMSKKKFEIMRLFKKTTTKTEWNQNCVSICVSVICSMIVPCMLYDMQTPIRRRSTIGRLPPIGLGRDSR